MSTTMDRSVRALGRALLAVHDVAPSSLAALSELLPELRTAGVSAVNLAVVPRFHGAEEWTGDGDLRRALAAAGPGLRTEIMQHGYTHVRSGGNERLTGGPGLLSRLQSSGEDEFYRLPPIEAEERIRSGRRVLETAFGRRPRVFVPPAWAGGPAFRCLLRRLGYAATEDHFRIYDLAARRKIFAPVIAFATRSPRRERLSMLWARLVRAVAKPGHCLRFVFHPADLGSPRVRPLALDLLAEVAPSREWALYSDILAPESPPTERS
ncbi:MAG TPA: DUF2334 domain-containing protein [Candidatus Aminicenantes bacterium]|nr:DUF2334 domain-containing protein [Candidatus Aminicenantes bacterium]